MKSQNLNASLPTHMRPIYHVSSLAKPFVYQTSHGTLEKGCFVITVKRGEDYYVVAEYIRKYNGPQFQKKDYDTMVALLAIAYDKLGSEISTMDTSVPGVELETFPLFFETEDEARYYIKIFENNGLDMVHSAKELMCMAWSQFYRDYYNVVV